MVLGLILINWLIFLLTMHPIFLLYCTLGNFWMDTVLLSVYFCIPVIVLSFVIGHLYLKIGCDLPVLFLSFVKLDQTEFSLIFSSLRGQIPSECLPSVCELWGFSMLSVGIRTILGSVWVLRVVSNRWFEMVVSLALGSFLTIDTNQYSAENSQRTLCVCLYCVLFTGFYLVNNSILSYPDSQVLFLNSMRGPSSVWVSPGDPARIFQDRILWQWWSSS